MNKIQNMLKEYNDILKTGQDLLSSKIEPNVAISLHLAYYTEINLWSEKCSRFISTYGSNGNIDSELPLG